MLTALLVEDDPAISRSVGDTLVERGYRVEVVGRGMDALASLLRSTPDIVLLDLGLPDVDGERVLAMARATSSVPVIVVTARSEEADIIRVLDLGADDYILKPFTVDQLEARIRAVLRRSGDGRPATEAEIWEIGDLRVDVGRHRVTLAGAEIALGKKEFEILALLARQQGMVTPRSTVLLEIWGETGVDAERRLDVHLTALRGKLGESGRHPRYLHSVRGVGLRLEPTGGS